MTFDLLESHFEKFDLAPNPKEFIQTETEIKPYLLITSYPVLSKEDTRFEDPSIGFRIDHNIILDKLNGKTSPYKMFDITYDQIFKVNFGNKEKPNDELLWALVETIFYNFERACSEKCIRTYLNNSTCLWQFSTDKKKLFDSMVEAINQKLN